MYPVVDNSPAPESLILRVNYKALKKASAQMNQHHLTADVQFKSHFTLLLCFNNFTGKLQHHAPLLPRPQDHSAILSQQIK